MTIKRAFALAILALVARVLPAATLANASDTSVAVIPVAFAYDQTQRDAWNGYNGLDGDTAVRQEIAKQVMWLNAVPVHSGVHIYYFVKSVQFVDGTVPATDQGNPSQALAHTLSLCHDTQKSTGASLFMYFTRNFSGTGSEINIGGMANAQPSSLSEFTADSGCAIAGGIAWSVMSHELGHLGGAGHDQPDNAAAVHTSFPYALGFVQPDNTCDIMSVYTPAGGARCSQQYVFSGPTSVANGKVYGDANHNNALVMNQSRWLVAGYAPEVLDTTPCVASDQVLCLQNNRFKVQVQWVTATNTGWASVAPYITNGVASDASSNFWFFSADNAEMLLKVLDACSFNQSFWVFFAATTDQGFQVIVTDTHTGKVKVYQNNLGTAALTVTDTSAFSCN